MANILTKRKVLTIFSSQRALAAKLGVDESWVSRWPMDKAIPEIQELRLRHKLMPEIAWDDIASQTTQRNGR